MALRGPSRTASRSLRVVCKLIVQIRGVDRRTHQLGQNSYISHTGGKRPLFNGIPQAGLSATRMTACWPLGSRRVRRREVLPIGEALPGDPSTRSHGRGTIRGGVAEAHQDLGTEMAGELENHPHSGLAERHHRPCAEPNGVCGQQHGLQGRAHIHLHHLVLGGGSDTPRLASNQCRSPPPPWDAGSSRARPCAASAA
jgi:hypothetical protein